MSASGISWLTVQKHFPKTNELQIQFLRQYPPSIADQDHFKEMSSYQMNSFAKNSTHLQQRLSWHASSSRQTTSWTHKISKSKNARPALNISYNDFLYWFCSLCAEAPSPVTERHWMILTVNMSVACVVLPYQLFSSAAFLHGNWLCLCRSLQGLHWTTVTTSWCNTEKYLLLFEREVIVFEGRLGWDKWSGQTSRGCSVPF